MKKRRTTLESAVATPSAEIGYWRVSTGRDQIPDMQIAALKRRWGMTLFVAFLPFALLATGCLWAHLYDVSNI